MSQALTTTGEHLASTSDRGTSTTVIIIGAGITGIGAAY